MKFRPTFWLTIATVPTFVLLLTFGWWQVERLQWKNELIEELNIRGAAPAIPLPADRRILTEDLVFRTVSVTGHYMHEAEMHLLNQVRDGIPGINVFTPLVREDGAGYVLVNRGWAPMDWPGTSDEDRVGEPKVEVIGVVRVPEEPGWLTPANQPEKNDWYYADLNEMAAAAAIVTMGDFYIYGTGERLLSGEPRSLLAPDPNTWSANLPNNHLSYAITWFSLAGVLLVIFVVYTTGRQGQDEE